MVPNMFIRKFYYLSFDHTYGNFRQLPVFNRFFADKTGSRLSTGLRPRPNLVKSGIPRRMRGQPLM